MHSCGFTLLSNRERKSAYYVVPVPTVRINVAKNCAPTESTGYGSEEIAIISTCCHGDMTCAHSALTFAGARM